MKVAGFLSLVVLGSSLLLSAQIPIATGGAPSTPQFVIVSSLDAQGVLSADRLKNCLHQLVREWKQDEKATPNVIVFHVSGKAARALGIADRVRLRRNESSRERDFYYEVWFVDAPTAVDYVIAFESLIENHFHLSPAEKEREEAIARAVRYQNATVSVYEGK